MAHRFAVEAVGPESDLGSVVKHSPDPEALARAGPPVKTTAEPSPPAASATSSVARRRDLYNPDPVTWEAPPAPQRTWTRADLIGLLLLQTGWLILVTPLLWILDWDVAGLIALGGGLVILESWSTSLDYLQRHPDLTLRRRVLVFLSALIPWILGLGVAALLMLGLLHLTDVQQDLSGPQP